MSKLRIELPKGFMNVGITPTNHLIADTNDSQNWDTLKFPLPQPVYKWQIYSYKDDYKLVILIDEQEDE